MKPSFGEPYDMAELRHALDDDREERAPKRKAAEEAEEAKRKEQAEAFRLTAMPLALKAKARVRAKLEEAAAKTEIVVGPVCRCRSFPYPHFLEAHKQLENEWDWRTHDQRESDESLRRSGAGRRHSADRVRDAADRRTREA